MKELFLGWTSIRSEGVQGHSARRVGVWQLGEDLGRVAASHGLESRHLPEGPTQKSSWELLADTCKEMLRFGNQAGVGSKTGLLGINMISSASSG